MLPLIIAHLVVIGLFVVLSLIFRSGRGAFLIAGYNTMLAVEKARYDEKKLCKAMGGFTFLLALLWLPVAAASVLDNVILLMAALLLFIVAAFVGGLLVDKRAKK